MPPATQRVVWQAGLECREPAEGIIYGSQMMVIENFDDARKPSRAEMSERIRSRGEHYGMIRRDGFAMSVPGGRTAVVNMTHIETPLDPFGSSKTGLEGKDQADRTMQFLKGEFPEAFADARVRAYGLPGIRQTRWIVGRHHLTRRRSARRASSSKTPPRARRGPWSSITTSKVMCGNRSLRITSTTCRWAA